MRNGRRDGNHAEIVKAARSVPGVSVFDTADVGRGFVDIVVGYRGRTYLIEIKDGLNQPPSKTKLTPAEQKFHDEWTGHVCVVNSEAEMLELLELADHEWPVIHLPEQSISAFLAALGEENTDNSQGVEK